MVVCLPKRDLWMEAGTINDQSSKHRLQTPGSGRRRSLALMVAIHSDQCCGVPGRKSFDANEDIPEVKT